MKANETQVGGAHYASEFQHWDFVQECLGGRYMEGQITKYVSRWRKKNGLQDLEKAAHFAAKLEELALAGYTPAALSTSQFRTGPGIPERTRREVMEYAAVNYLSLTELSIVTLCARWADAGDVWGIRVLIERLKQET